MIVLFTCRKIKLKIFRNFFKLFFHFLSFQHFFMESLSWQMVFIFRWVKNRLIPDCHYFWSFLHKGVAFKIRWWLDSNSRHKEIWSKMVFAIFFFWSLCNRDKSKSDLFLNFRNRCDLSQQLLDYLLNLKYFVVCNNISFSSKRKALLDDIKQYNSSFVVH